MKFSIWINTTFLVYNLIGLVFFGFYPVVFALALGFHAGLLLAAVTSWYLDRELNREIMEEINTLHRNYDNQMSFSWDEAQTHFHKNPTNKQEVTRND